jgi:hypothetical protein
MRTTHTMDLLLQKLPPDARMAHHLPELVNNLFSVAVLSNAGCKVYFHSTGCKVSLNKEIILQGWRDPTNQLWRVKITNDGWITNLKIKDDDTTCETPAGPAVVKANSLHECDNTCQLVNFCHVTLNYLAVSTLVKAMGKGYLKGCAGLTSRHVCQHIIIINEMETGHMDQS